LIRIKARIGHSLCYIRLACRSIVWRCKTRIGFGKTGCTSRTISEEELKNAVMDSVNEVFSNKDAIVPVLRQNISRMLADTEDDEVKAIRNELAGLERELAADPDKETEYGDRILSLRDELDAISAEHGRRGSAISSAEEFIEMLGEVRIDEYSEEITRTFINSIRVFPDRLKVVFKTGLEFDVG
ncbi:MAG: zinc ribbon domain-containing protein, partial [Spirochaetales bacterium]|nr:zinc ribbon domain-containing protein [Spirochaetales bacterium]